MEQLCCPRAPPTAHSRLLFETVVHSDQGWRGGNACRGRFLFRAAHCGCRTGTCATARSDGGGHASEDRRRRPLWPVPPRTSGARIVDGACDAYPRTSARAAAVKQAGSRWPPPRTRPASGVPCPEVPSCQFPAISVAALRILSRDAAAWSCKASRTASGERLHLARTKTLQNEPVLAQADSEHRQHLLVMRAGSHPA